MTHEEFILTIEKTYKDCVVIVKSKNKDYGGETDPFLNFRMANLVGVSPDRAILVRMSDKLSRISNCLDKEVSVVDEKVEDTLNDLINYTAILKAYLKQK